MGLPIYQHITVRNSQLSELENLLERELNSKHPVVLNLTLLLMEEQREMIGLIENFYSTNNVSYQFPYPVYLLTHHERTISHMPIVQKLEELPKFFDQKESKMNVKETHLIERNKLLQQEIKNADTHALKENIKDYSRAHRKIFEKEKELHFYQHILSRLLKKS